MTTSTDTLRAELGTSHRTGGRAQQHDALIATPGLVAIADGFGERPDLAAAVLTAFESGGIAAAVAEVAAEIADSLPEAPTSGTTLTAVTIRGATASVTHVGDGRLWLVRGQEVRQVTHDHTVVAALLESGQLMADEARSHPHRSLLNRALVPGVVTDDLEVRLQPGDRLVLTDGVHSHVEDLTSLLVSQVPPQQLADEVGDVVAASGEPDNHTIVVVDLT